MSTVLAAVVAAAASLGIPLTSFGATWALGWALGVLALGVVGVAMRAKVNRKVWFGSLVVFSPFFLALGLGFQYDPRQVDSPLLGKVAPDFALSPIDGGAPVRLSEQRGLPAVVNFWATWCVPCRDEHRTLVALAQRTRGKARFFGVVYNDEIAKIQAWIDERGGGYPQLLDVGSKAAVAFGVYGVPETYVVDAAGVITWKFTGPVRGAELLAEIERAGAR